jgi:diguanylate cyclase (GGDEF)-like protein
MLAERAQIDALTSLKNRAYFDSRLEQEVSAARNRDHTVSVLMLDVDHFKQINDRYGHPFGDAVLQAVGEMLQVRVRGTDVACRYGGEEFAAILPNATIDEACSAAQRIAQATRELQFTRRGQTVGITLSGGLACSDRYPRQSLTSASLLATADEALYRAKQSGRDRIECSAEIGEG